MEGKRVSDSKVVMAQMMNPQDANPAGNVHGGVIMRLIDSAAAAVAMRHARGNVVTVSIDRLDFIRPAFIGDLIVLKAGMNRVGRTSMEVGVRVEAETLTTGEVRHTSSAYLTYVALDHDGAPTEVPPLILETEEDFRRNREAELRRKTCVNERRQRTKREA